MTLPAAWWSRSRKKRRRWKKLYDTELMLGGGHIAGWAVTDAADIAAVENAVAALGTQAAFDAKYPDAAGRPPAGRRRGRREPFLPRPRRTGRK